MYWMNLKNIMVNELRYFQKVIYCTISFLWHSQKDRSIVTIEQIGGWQRAEVGGGCHYKRAAEGDLEGQGSSSVPWSWYTDITQFYTVMKIYRTVPPKS